MSYDDTIPTNKDHVRLLIGDTADEEFLSDGEIFFWLNQNNDDVLEAAVDCAESIAAKLASEVDYQASTLRQEAAQAYQHFTQRAKELKRRSEEALGLPVYTHAGDDPRDPIFTIGMHDETGSDEEEAVEDSIVL